MRYNILNDCRGMYESEVFETIMDQRGISDPDRFLNPTEDDLLPLTSMDRILEASACLERAIYEDKEIAVWFDTDTDGITAGAIMTRYLLGAFGIHAKTIINSGKQHGLKNQDLSQLNDVCLLIIVDSLDSTAEQYKTLSEQGIDIIILDHHAIKENIPYDDYAILVSSQRNYENPQLSGAGVVWKFCKLLDEVFNNDYADELTDLAACGLIADMMDMTIPENRYIVSKGLEKIRTLAIKKIVGSFEFNSTAIAFSIAPLINAANRLNENHAAMMAFLSDDNKAVLSYVKQLKKCKERQNEEVQRLMPDVIQQCEEQKENKVISVHIDTPYGISGLIGNKLLEKYKRPLFVVKDTDDSYSGSMRAVGVKDFRTICNESELAQADGHELASGIVIPKENYDKFLAYIKQNLPELDLNIVKNVDVQLSIADVNRQLIDYIKKIDRISGTGFKPVSVYIDDIEDYTIGQMSDYKHLVVKPNDYLLVIKWNFDGSFDEMEDHSLMGDCLMAVGELDSGFLGRKYVLKLVCDELEEVI